jgi:hypothetical protein
MTSCRIRHLPLVLPGLLLALALAAPVPAAAGSGSGELHLDRGAVASLVAAGMPESVPLQMPQLGSMTLQLSPPTSVRFVDGGVEATVGVRMVEASLRGEVGLRLVPVVRPRDGALLLRVDRAVGTSELGVLPDLAALLPEFELPRVYESLLQNPSRGDSLMTITLQRVEVRSERLVLEFGLDTRRARP